MSGEPGLPLWLCTHAWLLNGWCGPYWILLHQAVSPDSKFIEEEEETGHDWGAGSERPVLKGLSVDSRNLLATLTIFVSHKDLGMSWKLQQQFLGIIYF